MTLRLIERYTSFQGEGPNTGKPTMFVRFAGCNFKCAGWPCDTQHAIDPKIFTERQRMLTADELATAILSDRVLNICFTGGEPFLQKHEDLLEVWNILRDAGRTIEVFTNGSLRWPNLNDLVDTIILDWKLPGSGEFPSDDLLLENIKILGAYDAIKFTVKDREDFDRALFNWQQVILPLPEVNRPQIWCGPVWDAITPEKVARWILTAELPWHLNVQTHKYIWGPETIGV